MYRGNTVPAGLVEFVARPHSWERWLEDDLNGGWSPVRRPASVSLHPHQHDAARAIAAAREANRPGFLLADDVGLGKTYSAVAGVDAIGTGLNVLVLCPLSVVAHWRRSIDAAGNGTNRWCVINYDRTKQLLDTPVSATTAKRRTTANKRTANQGRSLVDWDVVVMDEAHLLRNPTSQRSAAVRRLVATSVKASRRTPAFVLWLSATAGQNPLELAYLAPLLAHVTGSAVRDLDQFEGWCRSQGIGVKRGAYGAWSWDRNPADLTLLRQLLFVGSPPAGLRRRPTDIAGWPEQQRVAFPVELTIAERRSYLQAWEEFQAAYETLRKAKKARTKAGGDNALTALLRFRQKASRVRVPATAALVEDLVASGCQVAVSVEFLDTADALIDHIVTTGANVVRIAGVDSAALREHNRVRFQTGDANVVVYTVAEGISLHAGEAASGANDTPRVNVVHSPRWSAIATAQIEGRTHRDGQSAVAYHCFAQGTVEEQVVSTTLQRLHDMKTMIGDDTDTLELLNELFERSAT